MTHIRVTLISVLFSVFFVYSSYAATAVGWVEAMVSGYSGPTSACPEPLSDVGNAVITSDWGVFTTIDISRDNGRTWFDILQGKTVTIPWGQPTVLSSLQVPVGHYTLSRNQQSEEWLMIDVDYADAGVPDTSDVRVDIGGDESLCEDPIDLEITRNGSATLSMNAPIVYIWVKVQYDDVTGLVSAVLDTEGDKDIVDAGMAEKFE
ncbi:MAG: hypothetical protein PHP69_06840 [Candidatus Omnitrophica bacterium]|nr:hypothetical protein [Candidatus Omnitrophota bacterium]MDD5081426.1 hypothetical protein [Candidatus Omnitrophota bacterium]